MTMTENLKPTAGIDPSLEDPVPSNIADLAAQPLLPERARELFTSLFPSIDPEQLTDEAILEAAAKYAQRAWNDGMDVYDLSGLLEDTYRWLGGEEVTEKAKLGLKKDLAGIVSEETALRLIETPEPQQSVQESESQAMLEKLTDLGATSINGALENYEETEGPATKVQAIDMPIEIQTQDPIAETEMGQILSIQIGELKIDPQTLGLSKEQEFILNFVLENRGSKSGGKYRIGEFLRAGFQEEVRLGSDRIIAFRDEFAGLAKILSDLSGKQVLARTGQKGGTRYGVASPILINGQYVSSINGEISQGPPEPTITIVPPHPRPAKRQPRQPARKTVTSPQPAQLPVRQIIEALRKMRDNSSPEYIPNDQLPPLDEVLAHLKFRDPEELRQHPNAIKIVDAQIYGGLVLDYRPKAIGVLRYGMFPPRYERYLAAITRGGQQYSVKDKIMPHVPPNLGLSIESTSLILGLTETAVIKAEIELLSKRVKNAPHPLGLITQLTNQLNALSKG